VYVAHSLSGHHIFEFFSKCGFICFLPSYVIGHAKSSEVSRKEKERSFRIGVLTAVGYAASIGGTGSMIGSSPQLALKGILQE